MRPASTMPGTRSWPRSWSYPTLGVALAAALPLGYVALRGLLATEPASLHWLASELRSQIATYAYLACTTTAAFALLGLIVGRNEDRLEASSITDALTGLPNRRYMYARVSEEMARAARYGKPLALLLLDLDGLKAINDQFGHEAGDAALRRVATSLRVSCRSSDLAARHGGDEFVVLAPASSAPEALVLADRIRATLHALSEKDPALEAPVTVSIGVTDTCGGDVVRPETLYQAADRALYAAKSGGGDRGELAPAVSVRRSSRRTQRQVQSQAP